MNRLRKLPWLRISAEGFAIVVSILAAFWIQAWWDARQADRQRLDYLVALDRDFEQMFERANASYSTAQLARNSGITLLETFAQGRVLEPESAMRHLNNVTFYEVFSPSVGGYESLVGSGAIELLRNSSLKRELAAFFGSFDDTRASEQVLVGNIFSFLRTPEFGHLMGVYRYSVPGFPDFGDAPIEEWTESEVLLNWIALLTLGQTDVIDDYEFLRGRIVRIREEIQKESGTS